MPTRSPPDADLLILGQGLAGSVLAWTLAQRGVAAIVFDRGGVDRSGRPSASRVAAGLVTPVTGKRLTVAADFDEQFDAARRFYRQVERQVEAKLFDERPAVRVFLDADERQRFEQRVRSGRLAKHARLAHADELPTNVATPHGGFVMPGAARLNVRAFLDATRRWLGREGRFIAADVDPHADLELLGERPRRGSVRVAGVVARRLVLCQGHATPPLQWLDGIDFAPAKGEVLSIDAANLRDDRVVHRGVWIAPCESGVVGRYRVGSTTEWSRLDASPTASGRGELLARLEAAGVVVERVVNHQAAVRPATPERRPTAGFSAAEPRVGWLNGLGAKGTLWAPWYARQLADGIAAERGGAAG